MGTSQHQTLPLAIPCLPQTLLADNGKGTTASDRAMEGAKVLLMYDWLMFLSEDKMCLGKLPFSALPRGPAEGARSNMGLAKHCCCNVLVGSNSNDSNIIIVIFTPFQSED
jgi:hypothetical protein